MLKLQPFNLAAILAQSCNSQLPDSGTALGTGRGPLAEMDFSDGPPWLQETRRRLEAARAEWPRGEVDRAVHEFHMATVTDYRGGSSASSARATPAQVRQSGLASYRKSTEGLTAAGFAPLRNTTMVHGRPVQVQKGCARAGLSLTQHPFQLNVPFAFSPDTKQEVCLSPSCFGGRVQHKTKVDVNRSCMPRPAHIQVLVLTHEGASLKEMEPYARSVFSPVTPVYLYGRSADKEPKCKREDAVYFGWMDRPFYSM